MIIYWNMLIWSSLLASLWRFFPRSVVCHNGANEQRANLFIAFLSFSIIIFFSGLRSGIADTRAYINIFMNMPEYLLESLFSGVSRDKGFALFTYIMKYFVAEDFQVWLFTIALISGVAVMLTLYRHSPMFELSTFLFIATAQFTWLLNGMRQFIAISILFLAVDLIINKRFKTYLAIVLLLSTIHGSAIIALPFYFLCQCKPWSKRIFVTVLAFSIIFYFLKPFIEVLDIFLEGTQYEGYAEEIEKYAGSNFIRLIVAAVPSVLVLNKLRKLREINDPLLNICSNMSVFSFCFMLLSTGIGGILLGRLAAYFDIYNLLLYPIILMKLYGKTGRLALYTGTLFCYTIWFYFQVDLALNFYYVSDVLDLYIYQ